LNFEGMMGPVCTACRLFYAQARAEENATKVAHGPRGEQGEKHPLFDRRPVQRKMPQKWRMLPKLFSQHFVPE